ncbi:MAG: hypothetical protein WCA21_05350 [Terracidiphilus sp.]
MARKPKQSGEFRFTIGAFTPSTIPMARLAEYMADFAVLLGNEKSVHPGGLEEGSTVLVAKVEWEAEPKVRERLHLVRNRSANERTMEAAARLDNRLADDNAKGTIADSSGSKVIEFPGRDRFQMPAFGPIQQPGSFQGIPIKIGGENDPVPVHLEDGKEKYIIHAKRGLAKEIAEHLFTEVVRVEGVGSWTRTASGVWEMKSFVAQSMRVIENASFRQNIAELRSIDSGWKKSKDPLKQLDQIRHGTK